MKKFILAFASLVCATAAQAAITAWEAYGSSITDSYIDGTAYLIEIPAGGASLSSMINHIKTNGLVDVTDKAIDTAIISEWCDVASNNVRTEDATATYYVLFVDKAVENFIFTNGATVSDTDVWTPVSAPSGTSYTAVYAEDGTEWAANGGTVGTGVPEPTALALLALGVAGLALRRKNA